MSHTDCVSVLERVRGARGRILAVTHERPDGDAIGSLCGFLSLLKSNGFEVDAFVPEGTIPSNYMSFIPAELLGSLPAAPSFFSRYSLLVSIDASTAKRVCVPPYKLADIPLPCVNIDHHPDNEMFGTVCNCVDPQASSAAEIVYDIACEAKREITPVTATLLLLGITTDTGCFRYSNTRPKTLVAAARLIEKGADHQSIVSKSYLAKTENMALFEAELVCNRMKKACSGKFAYFYLAPELLEKYSINLKDTETLIDALRVIDGFVVVALIRNEKDAFKVSLRSKDQRVSVGRVARRLNGGGHEMAAGCAISVPTVQEAEKILIENVENELNNASQS